LAKLPHLLRRQAIDAAQELVEIGVRHGSLRKMGVQRGHSWLLAPRREAHRGTSLHAASCSTGQLNTGFRSRMNFRSQVSIEVPATLCPGANAKVIVSSFGFQKLLAINRNASPVLN